MKCFLSKLFCFLVLCIVVTMSVGNPMLPMKEQRKVACRRTTTAAPA